MRHRYGSGPMPGPGDSETWGPVAHPSDPRYEEPPECPDCGEALEVDTWEPDLWRPCVCHNEEG